MDTIEEDIIKEPHSASVWGPTFWFFLHTAALTYPPHPNETTRKKYYELVANFPLFIPNPKMSQRFAEFLDEFPVSPYLGSRDSFVKWVFFAHNKYNEFLARPPLAFEDAMDNYLVPYERSRLLSLRRPGAGGQPESKLSTLEYLAYWWTHEAPRRAIFFSLLAALILSALIATIFLEKHRL